MAINIGRGLGKFAEGMMNGYVAGKKLQMEQEEHKLRTSKAKEELAMNEEFKALDEATKAVPSFVVQGEGGKTTVYTDEKLARKAAAESNAKIAPAFTVGGRQFDNEQEASAAAEAANSPAVRMRQKMRIAEKYNRADVAADWAKNYRTEVDNNRRDLTESFLQAQSMGDKDAVIDAYAKRLPNGSDAQIVPGENGGLTVQITRGGKVVKETPFASDEAFWKSMHDQVMTTPDNIAEIWKTRASLEQQKAAHDLNVKQVDANIRQGDARVDQGRQGLEIQGRQVDAGIKNDKARIGIMGRQVDADIEQFYAPTPASGFNGEGELSVTGIQRIRPTKENPNGGLRTLPAQTVKGLLPMPMASQYARGQYGDQDPLGLGLGGNGSTAGQPDILGVLGSLPPRNLAPAK